MEATSNEYYLFQHMLSGAQLDFIARACNVEEAVIQYDVSDKEFKKCYGCTKKQMRAAVNDLYKLVKE